MVSVPFTEIDNHIQSVNFGSRMLLREDTEAYTWLLTSLMTAHEKQPTMIVTDQDGAMKREIEAVLTEYTHRLCMWHIMQKVPAKEGKETVIQEKDKVVDYKVVRNHEDGSVECTCRHFLGYGFLCRHVFCVLKNCNIEVIPERYILRHWRRNLIPPALRKNTNRYGEKDKAIEKLTNEANFVVDECLFLLRKDEEQLKQFVEKLENVKKEIQVKVPNPPSQKMGDAIEDIYAIKKPKQNLVNNPQKASKKGGRRGEQRKSGREIAMKAKAKRARKCGYCAEKTNKHVKTTCPLNPKYIAKLARIEAAPEQERRTAVSATEQEERNSDTTHIADKEQLNTAF
nr:zinc finger, SWIM-type [Tanacetum cinerariifolium]